MTQNSWYPVKLFVLCISFLFTFQLYGCIKRPPLTPPWPSENILRTQDTEQVIKALNEHYSPPLKTLRAKVNITVKGVESSSPSLKGEIILKKPQQIRLRTYSPLGSMAFDLLYRKEALELYLPHRKEVVIVPLDKLHTLELGDLPLTLPEPDDWWRIVEPWKQLSPLENKKYSVETTNNRLGILKNNGVKRDQTLFEWSNGRISQLNLTPKEFLQYREWKTFQRKEFASLVYWQQTSDANHKPIQIQFHLSDIEWDLELSDQVFQPISQNHLKITQLGD